MSVRFAGAFASALLLCACSAETRQPDGLLAPANVAMASGEPAAGPFAPKDECAMLPAFESFRQSLVSAVEARDTDALIALSHPAIKLDFGGGAGIDELRRRLDADESLWSELAALGCASDNPRRAVMPWIFDRAPDDVDAFEAAWVTGNGVVLRNGHSHSADAAATLDHDLVRIDGADLAEEDALIPVRTFGEAPISGYLPQGSLRSLLDYRLIAERSARGWLIMAFIAGE